jgi:DNA-binding MarR family transcriptional regulator
MRPNRKPVFQDDGFPQLRLRRQLREDRRFEPTLGFHLTHLVRDWTARFEKQLRKKGVTHDQWRVLLVTSQVESMNIMELRDATLVPHSTLGRWLHRMEALGLVHLRTDAKDQRSVAISIAPQGRKLFESLYPIAERCERDALAGFSKEDERLFRDYLKRVAHNVQSN